MKKNISRDFTWEEMTYSCIAIVNGLRNDPPEEARCAICELVKCLLQPLRIAELKCPGRTIRLFANKCLK